jgi:hypothetical protein
MPHTSDAAVDQAYAYGLMSFIKGIPVGESLLRRSWPRPPWCALAVVVPLAGRGAGDLEWQ